MNEADIVTKARNMVFELIKKNSPDLKEKQKKEILDKIQKYLDNKGLGIHILSTTTNGKTDIQIANLKTDSIHINETFKQLMNDFPGIKQEILKIIENEKQQEEIKNEEERVKKNLLKMIR